MKNWKRLLNDFETMFKDVIRLPTPLAASNGIDFLRSTVHLHKGKEVTKVLTNVNMAAFYVHFLLQVCTSCWVIL